jgi:hypothetical protein
MKNVPLTMRRDMWLQHDGAAPHFSLVVWAHLNIYREQWIGRVGPIVWPAWSPDLMPLDFFLWGNVNSVMYATPVDTRHELTVRIHTAFEQFNTDLKCSTESDNHCYDGVMNVIRFRVDALNTCKLSTKVLEEINE